MDNNEEKYCYKKKKAKKESTKNVTEDVIYDEILIAKMSNQKYDIKTFIADSGVTSYMVK